MFIMIACNSIIQYAKVKDNPYVNRLEDISWIAGVQGPIHDEQLTTPILRDMSKHYRRQLQRMLQGRQSIYFYYVAKSFHMYFEIATHLC